MTNVSKKNFIKSARYFRWSLFIVLALTLAEAHGQYIRHECLGFKSREQGKTYLEVYFALSNQQVQFTRSGSEYLAKLEATVYLYGLENDVFIRQGLTQQIVEENFDKTISSAIETVFNFPFKVKPGAYEAEIFILDRNSGREFSDKFKITARDYYCEQAVLSDLKIGNAGDQDETCSPPKLTHTFDWHHSSLQAYFETYNITKEQLPCWLTTEMWVLNESGTEVQKTTGRIRVSDQNCAFKFQLSVDDLPTGNYRLRITQMDSTSGWLASTQQEFRVVQCPLDLRFKSYEQALEELVYIASPDQIDQLKKVPADARQQALERFWKEKDPSPETDINEIFDEYYIRLQEADNLFRNGKQEGWRTDFGMVYMLFGRPDKIFQSKAQSGFEEQRVWFYEQLGMRFVFINWQLYQDFTLVDKNSISALYLPK